MGVISSYNFHSAWEEDSTWEMLLDHVDCFRHVQSESEKAILSSTKFESSNLHSQIQSALRTKPKHRAGLAGSLILIPRCARGREQHRIRIILILIPRCALGGTQRRIRISLILIPRCALEGTQRRIVKLG